MYVRIDKPRQKSAAFSWNERRPGRNEFFVCAENSLNFPVTYDNRLVLANFVAVKDPDIPDYRRPSIATLCRNGTT
jgi:hypothetical protein